MMVLVGFEKGKLLNTCIFHIGEIASRLGVLSKLICPLRARETLLQEEVVIEMPRILRGISLLISWVGKTVEDFPARYYNEQVLFDLFAQKHINSDADVVVHTDSGLIRSLRKATSLGIPTVVIQRTLHPAHMADILIEEHRRLGIREDSIFIHSKWNANRIMTLRACKKVLALSELERDSLCKYGIPSSKIEVLCCGQGVDVDHFKPSEEKYEVFTVLFVGHTSLIKGVPYLLKAWKRLSLKDAKLIIIGHQNKRILEAYRKTVRFEAPGVVEDPLRYYQRSHVFVLPSLGDAFPRVVLEAMACGLPVIISDMVGAKEIIRDGKEGFVVPARDSWALAEKIRYFYDNPDEVKSMGREARRTAEKYTWERFAQEVIEKALIF